MLQADGQHDFRADTNSAEASLLSWHEGVGPIAIFFSFLLHISVVVIMTVGLPFLPEPPVTEITNIVAVEFVEIAENTESDREVSRAKNKDEKTRAKIKKPDVKPNVDAKAEKPKPRSAPTVDAKSQPLTVSKDKGADSTPPPADAVPLPEELKIEKPEKNLAPIKPKKPNKRPKKPEPKAAKPEKSFDSVLKNLQITDNSQAAPDEGEQAQNAAPKTPTLGQRITVSELDALRGQLAECWNVLAGANFDSALVVYIKLHMNPDRTVRRYEIKDKLRYSTDSFFRAAADSAARAVNNPSCSPLKLPAGKYDQWKVITVKFDPREML
jgi:hypothetical protein